MMETNEALLKPAEVANLLGVAPVTVRAWAAKGLFANRLTPGGHRRFARYEVERFARERGMLVATPSPSVAQRALLVDDNSLNWRLLADFLAQFGIEILSAVDGFSAGFQLATLRPDLVFLNDSMPGIDSLQVCRQIKADDTMGAVRVVMIGDAPGVTSRAALLAAGVENFFALPLDLASLATQLALVAVQCSLCDEH